MFQPREIIYGYAKGLYMPHNKYLVVIYQDDNLSIVACFATSKSRAGVPEKDIHHGAIYRNRKCVSYVFDEGKYIGVNPQTGEPFSFPKRTVITFDYGVREAPIEFFLKEFNNPKVVCVLNEQEYIDLVYAMYSSPDTDMRHKQALDKILREYYSSK